MTAPPLPVKVCKEHLFDVKDMEQIVENLANSAKVRDFPKIRATSLLDQFVKEGLPAL